MFDIINIKFDKGIINNKRKEISRRLLQESETINDETAGGLSAADLEMLFQFYDEEFFSHWFKENYRGEMKFSLSGRMTRSAGLTICPKNISKIKPEQLVLEIRIGRDFFLHYNSLDETKTVGGISTSSSLEALQLVFEHELCHVIEFLLFNKSSCKGKRFKALASNLFGHTEGYHRLPTYRKMANQKLGLNIGDRISFTHDGRKLTGILYNINKRAIVMVKDSNGTLTDQYGVRYSKYYVPLTLIEYRTPVSDE